MPSQKPLPPVGPGRKPGTKFAFKPQSEHEKAKRVAIPPAPTIARSEDRAAADAQQSARVEILMLKGLSSPKVLGSLLGIESEREVNRLIALVHARWQITGSGRDIKRARGESLARLSLLASEIWSKLSDNGDLKASDRNAMYRLLIDISAQQDQLSGLAPRIIERMALIPDGTNVITGKMAEQTGLAAMAGRLLEMMADRRSKFDPPQTIEHSSDEDFSDDAETTSH